MTEVRGQVKNAGLHPGEDKTEDSWEATWGPGIRPLCRHLQPLPQSSASTGHRLRARSCLQTRRSRQRQTLRASPGSAVHYFTSRVSLQERVLESTTYWTIIWSDFSFSDPGLLLLPGNSSRSSSYPGPACLLFSPSLLPAPLPASPLLSLRPAPFPGTRLSCTHWDWPCSDSLELLSYPPATLIYVGSSMKRVPLHLIKHP